jgi:hypothetical protein
MIPPTQYEPAGHGVHAKLFTCALYVPEAHVPQTELMDAVQLVWMTWPTVHMAHDCGWIAPPVQKELAGHAVHVVSADAVQTAERYVPAAQTEQV